MPRSPASSRAAAPRPPAPVLPAVPPAEPAQTCPRCRKPEPLCVCAALSPVRTRTRVVILQHPQEQDEALGTGWITRCQIQGAELRVGLSWPSLKRILDRELDMKRWAVLYLGAARDAPKPGAPELQLCDRHGETLEDGAATLNRLEGLILLDGTWAQAKTLWWRNPWLLKAHRLVLNPPQRSLYGRLRREPRKQALAIIEAAAFALSRLERRPTLEAEILRPFQLLVDKVKTPPAGDQSADPETETAPAAALDEALGT